MLAGIGDAPNEPARMYPDYDHFEVYRSDGAASLFRDFAATMKSGAEACKLYEKLAPAASISRSAFVGTAPPPRSPVADSRAAPPAERAPTGDPPLVGLLRAFAANLDPSP
jgi:hypothetical protein